MSPTLTELAHHAGKKLQQSGLKLVTVESCTGGGLSYFITSIPGSSQWFERGFVTYSDQAKIEMVGVNPSTLTLYGAVSAATAREMAAGALQHSAGNISIAITGIAGPDGGSADKPVGTVWIAWAGATFETQAQLYSFTGDRTRIREFAMTEALQRLMTFL